ncbi:conserved domain protein [Afipia carboxidovorans OM5]|uniref:Uncharacterized protein n=1 Tax=Afipia carboxidovorans (strain ATCC 49405 / DSM 1227 / KCTC 32145 / OM5) TaxID=504832 RepID=B6JAR8_AFIC5|nr:hypothetical protein [Afipia carboxidovorans]ACI91431.1 conserved domain protein [Afipia carboxidovorans OM5]AEI04968.1 hypothetical protein OCA5_c02390 [Afipia carboxidovorans OM5]BEV45738.1 hypothetical protein CRBSH125_19210 [Afipia carboxidovorans]
MPGFMPGIHVLEISISEKKDVDGRDKPGHDGQSISVKTKNARREPGIFAE